MQFHGQMYIIGDSKYEKNEKEQQVESYQTVYRGGMGEIIEKKSRFIATVRLVETEEEALAFIEEMKKKYWSRQLRSWRRREKNIGMQDITAGHMFLEEIQLLRE